MGAGLKPTPRQVEAFTALRGSGDFRHVLEAVAEYERLLTDRLVTSTDPVVIHQTQGAIAALREIRKQYDLAPTLLTKIQGRT